VPRGVASGAVAAPGPLWSAAALLPLFRNFAPTTKWSEREAPVKANTSSDTEPNRTSNASPAMLAIYEACSAIEIPPALRARLMLDDAEFRESGSRAAALQNGLGVAQARGYRLGLAAGGARFAHVLFAEDTAAVVALVGAAHIIALNYG
jgi:hypothetical protein